MKRRRYPHQTPKRVIRLIRFPAMNDSTWKLMQEFYRLTQLECTGSLAICGEYQKKEGCARPALT